MYSNNDTLVVERKEYEKDIDTLFLFSIYVDFGYEWSNK